ncbi:MAG: PC4/YdbC family ssDNA-binding protein [Tissierellia bacterium]|nr:PC4/YdbC family ssDNA-binding protein [Tissierellia bacterium]
MSDFTFEIVKRYGVLSERQNGWTKEVNFVSYGGRPPKLDIRDWDPDHEKMSKGLTFTEEEAKLLRDILNDIL